jgi:hypothetical protein
LSVRDHVHSIQNFHMRYIDGKAIAAS